ncbi:MAG: TVP38/TMEM64 family protein [Gemmatimonadales bacterium]|nr:MAG: TVP38/TMEM64 family protein [Gemmatimonadales bacterium]
MSSPSPSRHSDPTPGDTLPAGPAPRDVATGEDAVPGGAPRSTGGSSRVRLVVLGLLALVGLIVLGRFAGQYIEAFALWVDGLGALAPIVFIAGYAVATVAFIPGSILTLAAGAVFGITQGVLYVFAGAVLGSTAAFLVGRHLARDRIRAKVSEDPRFSAIDRAIGREGLKIVTLLRLTPVMPYNLLNYALGLTDVRLRDYVIGALGMLPGTLLYVYSGRVAGDIATAAAGEAVERGWGYWVVLVLGLLATVAVTVLVTRIARRALAREAST